MVYSIRSSPIYAHGLIFKILPCDSRVTFVCQLTTRFLSEAAQNDGGGGQWGKKNQVAADAGLKPQVTVSLLPLRPGRRRWLARSRKYEVRTCLAAGVIAPNSCCAPPTQTHTLPGLKHLVIPEPMAVRGWVVATCPNQSNLLCRLVIETDTCLSSHPWQCVCVQLTPHRLQVFRLSR
jgi:hypothetical protein